MTPHIEISGSVPELGHCLQEGYGVKKNGREGRRLLVQANMTVAEVHPVNLFLREWFESGLGEVEDGLRLCGHIGCGRAETRQHEFGWCSVCRKVYYCSGACHSLDWILRHKMECSPMERVFDEDSIRRLKLFAWDYIFFVCLCSFAHSTKCPKSI